MQGVKLTIAFVVVAIACGGGESDRLGVAAVNDLEPVELSETNHAPTIRSLRIEPKTPISGDRVRAVVATEDADGDTLRLGFVWKLNGRSIDTGESSVELSGVAKGDLIQVDVTASDGLNESEVVRAEARVRNQPPVMLGVTLRPEGEVAPGADLIATALARDPDGDSIDYTYRWRVNDTPISHREAMLDTRELVRGDQIQVFVFASDGDEESDSIESIVVRVGNAPPMISSNPDGNWSDGAFRYEIQARDPDRDGTLRYSLREGPDGMTLDPVLGVVLWTPNASQAGTHQIEVAVSDRQGATALQLFELSVKLDAPPAAVPE